jgi:hypothetical protein
MLARPVKRGKLFMNPSLARRANSAKKWETILSPTRERGHLHPRLRAGLSRLLYPALSG